ncbi:MAG TPA: Os1348 family NHLP clan protein [Thermoanaerobaculia bacterium]|nr:Os1348 family NHLP clan protein [Thermoanaerobaculia bacterium]
MKSDTMGDFTAMSQKCVEMIFGKLATDEEMRRRFEADPLGTLAVLAGRGLELTRAECEAIVATKADLFTRLSEAIDPRLQKASLSTDTAAPAPPAGERRPS